MLWIMTRHNLPSLLDLHQVYSVDFVIAIKGELCSIIEIANLFLTPPSANHEIKQPRLPLLGFKQHLMPPMVSMSTFLNIPTQLFNGLEDRQNKHIQKYAKQTHPKVVNAFSYSGKGRRLIIWATLVNAFSQNLGGTKDSNSKHPTMSRRWWVFHSAIPFYWECRDKFVERWSPFLVRMLEISRTHIPHLSLYKES